MRLLSLLLWIGGVCALIGGFTVLSADVSPWPFIWAAAGVYVAAALLHLVRSAVGR